MSRKNLRSKIRGKELRWSFKTMEDAVEIMEDHSKDYDELLDIFDDFIGVWGIENISVQDRGEIYAKAEELAYAMRDIAKSYEALSELLNRNIKRRSEN